jgi:hypothetical protein
VRLAIKSSTSCLSHVRIFARERAERTSAVRERVTGAAITFDASAVAIFYREVRVSSEGHPQQEPVVWARQRAPTAGVRGHFPAEDTLTDHIQSCRRKAQLQRVYLEDERRRNP